MMQLKNSSNNYGLVSILLHWLMALLIIGMFVLGVYMVGLSYVDPWYKSAPYTHVSVGMLILFLLIFRLAWRLSNTLPVIYGQGIEPVIALIVHRMHYLFMFALTISGYLIITADGRAVEVFTWFEVPALMVLEKGWETFVGKLHMVLAWAFMAFIGLHAAAALKHHFIDKDRTLLRMLGIKKED